MHKKTWGMYVISWELGLFFSNYFRLIVILFPGTYSYKYCLLKKPSPSFRGFFKRQYLAYNVTIPQRNNVANISGNNVINHTEGAFVKTSRPHYSENRG